VTAGPSARPPSGPGPVVPQVWLPCFTGGELVRVGMFGRPSVINLWASSCAPCRRELPELERFARQADGVVVLGVITGDTRAAAAAAAADFGVTFAAVFDPDMTLLHSLGRTAIPVTLFVDGQGHVRHVDASGSLTYPALVSLSRAYLGVPGSAGVPAS
jgi:thiol-disulfide isomerase/thioredoxin